MVDLTKSIVTGMRAHDVSRLVLQAGALSHAPGSVSPLLVRLLLRPIMGTAAGLMGMLRDNDELMAWLHAEARDLEWTVTRPGRIVDEPSRGSLETSSTLSDTSTFVDLASLSLDLVSRSAYVHAFPYVNYRA